jgi:hypothetical protein
LGENPIRRLIEGKQVQRCTRFLHQKKFLNFLFAEVSSPFLQRKQSG